MPLTCHEHGFVAAVAPGNALTSRPLTGSAQFWSNEPACGKLALHPHTSVEGSKSCPGEAHDAESPDDPPRAHKSRQNSALSTQGVVVGAMVVVVVGVVVVDVVVVDEDDVLVEVDVEMDVVLVVGQRS